MGKGLSRRGFALGCIAAGLATGVAAPLSAAKRASNARTPARSNDDKLASKLDAAFTTVALAYLGGYGPLISTMLAAIQAKDPGLDAKRLQRVFRVLLTGDIRGIESALSKNGYSIKLVSKPLILLGRAELLPPLHDNVLRQLGPGAKSDFTASAALALAAGDEWNHALRILARAEETGAGIDIEPVIEDRLWKYAYLHRRLDSVMPVLAEVPFLPEFPELIEYRKWKLKACQIRAGLPGERVPIVEGEQALGYSQAAAMQVAALADDPSAADYVANLRRVIKARTISTRLAGRGFALSVSNASQAFTTAETQIAARRKDIARVETLARTPLEKVVLDPPTVAIDALLDERNWRAAAAIAQEHDPRERPANSWHDDDSEQRYARLYSHIAIAAAREGDDASAAAFFTKTKVTNRRDRSQENADLSNDGSPGFEFLLALLADNRLPRKYLDVMVPALIVESTRRGGYSFTRTPK